MFVKIYFWFVCEYDWWCNWCRFSCNRTREWSWDFDSNGSISISFIIWNIVWVKLGWYLGQTEVKFGWIRGEIGVEVGWIEGKYTYSHDVRYLKSHLSKIQRNSHIWPFTGSWRHQFYITIITWERMTSSQVNPWIWLVNSVAISFNCIFCPFFAFDRNFFIVQIYQI